MQLRDVVFFLIGAGVCGGALAAFGALGVPGGGARGPAVPTPVATTPAAVASARPPALDPSPASNPAEPVPAEEARFFYTEDGPVTCGEACVARLAEAFLDGTIDAASLGLLTQAGEAAGAYLGATPARRRRLVDRVRLLAAAEATGERGFEPVFVLMGLTQGLPADTVGALADALMGARRAELRPYGISLLLNADVPDPAKRRALSRVIGQSQSQGQNRGGGRGGAEDLLLTALQYAQGVGGGPLDPATRATVRDLARYHEAPAIRTAALAAFVQDRPDAPEATRLIDEALASGDPALRLGGLYALSYRPDGPPDEAKLARHRALLSSIADDPEADTELRMAALGLLTYEFADEGAARVDD